MSEIIIYQTEDGKIELEVKLEDDTIWVSQKQLCELFGRDKSVISRHIRNIFNSGELDKNSTVAKNATVQIEGNREVIREIEFYNLDVIISVGYRVNSRQATRFRQWATKILKEYLIKGFVLNDNRLKNENSGYFDELLERIRDIRSSEKVFWRKVLDIYATSVDYDPSSEISKNFFKTIQNKMHYATSGKTAAEIVYERADSQKLNMGMTNFSGSKPRKKEVSIAKNYLNKDEIYLLNGLVSSYLEFAELQAKRRKVMSMKDWIKKLDDFLTFSDFEVLRHKGKISHKQALNKANMEYEKYKRELLKQKSKAEIDFENSIKKLEKKNGI